MRVSAVVFCVPLALVAAGCHGAPPASDTDAGPRDPYSSLGEICGNGIDDEGDGAIDCVDVECRAAAIPPSTGEDDFADSVSFLFEPTTGECAGEPVQTGIREGAIDRELVAVIRGRVIERDETPVLGAEVRVVGGEDLGRAVTDGAGLFAIAVNADRAVVLDVRAPQRLRVQRTVYVARHTYAWAGDIVLTARDSAATNIRFEADGWQVAQGSEVSDDSGQRRATLAFQPRTRATLRFADGRTEQPASLTIRATEYTVGERGPDAMPGSLPAQSGYTYAIEVDADETVESGARIELSRPVALYVDNFLHFPVGTPVPVGSYDRVAGRWDAESNGTVVAITAIESGEARVDTDGDGEPDDRGIDDDERRLLASTYSAGATLWRSELSHFTPYDCNWPFGPPPGAVAPSERLARLVELGHDSPCIQYLSIIECQNQVAGELIPLAGTGAFLAYTTARVPGRRAPYTVEIPLPTEGGIPSDAVETRFEIEVAGQFTERVVSAGSTAAEVWTWTWNGQDAFGRTVEGTSLARVRVGYAYEGVYREPGRDARSFGLSGGETIDGDPAREEITLFSERVLRMGVHDARRFTLGGLSISPVHHFDTRARVVELGDGSRVDYSESMSGLTLFAGVSGPSGIGPVSGDGRAAVEAVLGGPASGIAAHPDGRVLLAAGGVVRAVRPDGIIERFAGRLPIGTSSGDGGAALDAGFTAALRLAIGPRGEVYVIDANSTGIGFGIIGGCIRRIDADGSIRTHAGVCGARSGSGTDGTLATSAQIFPLDLTVDREGRVVFTEPARDRVRRIRADGTLETIAGGGTEAIAPRVSPLSVRLGGPGAIAADPREGVWVVTTEDRVLRITDGAVSVVMGAGRGPSADRVVPTDATFNLPLAIAVSSTGEVCVADTGNYAVRCLGADGVLTARVGARRIASAPLAGERVDATQVLLPQPVSLAFAPDGSLFIGGREDSVYHTVYRADAPIGTDRSGHWVVPSPDGAVVWRFDSRGEHIDTLDPVTGLVITEIGRDSSGRLDSVTDRFGNALTIERDGDGDPTAVVAPFGQRTIIEPLDADGWVSAIALPDGARYELTYDRLPGLLHSFVAPEGTTGFQYDEEHRLREETSVSGAVTTLDRSLDASGAVVVDVTGPVRGLERTYTTGSDRMAGATETHDVRAGGDDGPADRLSILVGGARRVAHADGTIVTYAMASDPRFGRLVEYARQTEMELPVSRQRYTTRRLIDFGPSAPWSGVDARTLVERRQLADGHTWTSTWVAATRTHTVTSPLGRTSTTVYDDRGLVVSTTASGLATVTYAHDGRGRLESITADDGTSTRTTAIEHLTPDGAASALLDAEGTVVEVLARDPMLRATEVSARGAGTTSMGYDTAGRMTTLTPPDRGEHGFGYHASGRPESHTPPPDVDPRLAASSAYDTAGVSTSATTASGTASFELDSMGRLQYVDAPEGRVEIRYDDASRVSHVERGSVSADLTYDGPLPLTMSWHGPIEGVIRFTPDTEAPRARTLTVNDSASFSWDWDDDGLITVAGDLSMTRDPETGIVSSTTLGTVVTTHGWNDLGEPDAATWTRGGVTLFSETVRRDALGRITRSTETLGGRTRVREYDYDDASRLETVTEDGTRVAHVVYEATGARDSLERRGTTVDVEADGIDRVERQGDVTYTWLPDGTRETRTAAGATTRYEHDWAGTLTAVVLPDGSRIEYEEDVSGRRALRRGGSIGERRWLWLDRTHLIAELDAANAVTTLFVWGAHNVPEYFVRGGLRYRIVADLRGSVRLVVNEATGAIEQELDYDAWGVVTRDTRPGFQPFGFAGGVYDPDTGLVLFGARTYDPETGSWLEAEPLGYAAGVNLYEYAGGDPVNHVDPDGNLFFLIPLIGLAGIAAYTAYEAWWAYEHEAAMFHGHTECVDTNRVLAATGRAMFMGATMEIVGVLGGEVAAPAVGRFLRGPGCFAEGTPVETDHGLVPIEEIEPGTLVWAADDETGEAGWHPIVERTVRRGALMALELLDEHAGTTELIEVTGEHPFYEREHGWTPARELRPGDEIFTSRGGWARIGAGTWIEGEQLVYNLEVEGAHTYFVGDTGAWVHNQCGAGGAVISGASHGAAGSAASSSRVLLRTAQQLQAKFKHAVDFGVIGNYSKLNGAAFSRAIHTHINGPGVRIIQGTYHQVPVTHFLDPVSGLNVMADAGGNFISGWRLSPAQLQNVLAHGGL